MSIRRNVLANYLGQFYVVLIGIVTVPIYLRCMGREAFGLIGFFGVFNAWLALLDVGLSPALAREVARYRAGAIDADALRSLHRSMLLVFAGGGLGIVALVGLLSDVIARHWLTVYEIPQREVVAAIALMGLIFALKWPGGIFRSLLTGFERQISINAINVGAATLRSVGVLPVFVWMGATPRVFFGFQALAALAELACWAVVGRRCLPKGRAHGGLLQPLVSVWKFALSVAFLSVVWMLVTQTDRLLLTRLLPMAAYACYAIAVTAAGGVLALFHPISQAVLPRLIQLATAKDREGLESLYRKTTRIVCIVTGAATTVCAIYAQPLLWAWTGDASVAAQGGLIFSFYALGNGLLAVSSMQYLLQFAHGDFRLHLRFSVLFPLILTPSMIGATIHYGAVGASLVWMLSNLFFFLGWTPIVHRRFLPGIHLTWLAKDVLPAISALAAAALLMGLFPLQGFSRKATLGGILAAAVVAVLFAGLATPEGRTAACKTARRILHRSPC
jgi:O-antigen/teichoic acid export membrane protein